MDPIVTHGSDHYDIFRHIGSRWESIKHPASPSSFFSQNTNASDRNLPWLKHGKKQIENIEINPVQQVKHKQQTFTPLSLECFPVTALCSWVLRWSLPSSWPPMTFMMFPQKTFQRPRSRPLATDSSSQVFCLCDEQTIALNCFALLCFCLLCINRFSSSDPPLLRTLSRTCRVGPRSRSRCVEMSRRSWARSGARSALKKFEESRKETSFSPFWMKKNLEKHSNSFNSDSERVIPFPVLDLVIWLANETDDGYPQAFTQDHRLSIFLPSCFIHSVPGSLFHWFGSNTTPLEIYQDQLSVSCTVQLTQWNLDELNAPASWCQACQATMWHMVKPKTMKSGFSSSAQK